MRIYRGIFDILPEEIDPVFIGQGSFGDGTYYAFDENTALAYCLDAQKFGILYEAEINLENNITLHSDNVEGLRGYRGESIIKSDQIGNIEKEFLTESIFELGFSSVSLMGIIDGGEQLIILDRSSNIQILRYKLIIHKERLPKQDLEWSNCEYDSHYQISKFLSKEEIIFLIQQINLV